MIFRGDIVKMADNPTRGSVGTTGLFEVIIHYHDGRGSEADWRYFETTAQNVTFEEAQELERNRLSELRTQNKQES